MPAIILWSIQQLSSKVKGAILKTALVPLFILFGIGFGYIFMSTLGEALAEYKLDTILRRRSSINEI